MKSLIMSLLFLTGCTTIPARADSTFKQCPDDAERQALRSQEVQTLVKADQDDRTDPIDWVRVLPRDEARRKRIGEIFGEGSTAKENSLAKSSATSLICVYTYDANDLVDVRRVRDRVARLGVHEENSVQDGLGHDSRGILRWERHAGLNAF
jgi:hypothetical protein